MSVIHGRMVLYGVNDISEKSDNIIKSLNLRDKYFEIKLIISEAVNNAYVHGNNSDNSKPISVEWELKEDLLSIIVKDCGQGIKNINLYKEIDEEKILDESGRGLYIISCYTDELMFDGSSIIMKKYLLCNIKN